jgi:hypothetical protein
MPAQRHRSREKVGLSLQCLAANVFGLSQTLRAPQLTAEYAAKRRILESVFFDHRREDVNLDPTTRRKPFDVFAEGLLWKTSRGDKTAIELFLPAS